MFCEKSPKQDHPWGCTWGQVTVSGNCRSRQTGRGKLGFLGFLAVGQFEESHNLWGIEAIPTCLVPGPGSKWDVCLIAPEYKRLIKEVVGVGAQQTAHKGELRVLATTLILGHDSTCERSHYQRHQLSNTAVTKVQFWCQTVSPKPDSLALLEILRDTLC